MSMAMRTVDIDRDAVCVWLKEHGMTLREMSIGIGRSEGYLYGVVRNGQMKENVYNLMRQIYGLPEGIFLTKQDVKQGEQEEKSGGAVDGYQIRLDVYPNKLNVEMSYLGQPMYDAYAWIKGDTELDLVQAFSYAAHLLYKKAEQDALKGA